MAQDTIILPVRAQRTERVSGRFFTVLSCTAKFTVELDGRIRREVRAGSKIGGEPFSRISFIETEGLANTVVYDAGDSEYQGEIQVSGVSENTFDEPYLMPTDGSNNGMLKVVNTDGVFRVIPLIIPVSGVNYTRKSFHISHRTGSGDLGIYTSDGIVIDAMSVNTDRTFTFNREVKLKGIGGDCYIALYCTLYKTTPA